MSSIRNNRQIYDTNEQKMGKQNEILDDIIGEVDSIDKANKEMKGEL